MRATPQIGGDPNIGAQPHVYDRLWRVARRVAGTCAMRASASCVAADGPAKQ
jgi:hypothetical protein